MPAAAILPWIPTILSAGEFIWNKISADTNAFETKKSQEEANAQNRAWALEDWNRQNEYNHPEQVMNRLRQAGLNPNLVYGKGADMASAVIKSSESKPTPALQAPVDTKGLSNSIMQSQQLQLNQSQIDLQNAQRYVLEEEAVRKRMDNIQYSEANFPQSGNIYTYEKQMKSAELDLKQTEAEIKKKLIDNSVQQAVEDLTNKQLDGVQKQAQNLLIGAQKDKTIAEIDNVKQNLQLLKTQTYSLLLEQSLKKLNMTYSDPLAVRIGLALASTKNLQLIINDVNLLTEFIEKTIK